MQVMFAFSGSKWRSYNMRYWTDTISPVSQYTASENQLCLVNQQAIMSLNGRKSTSYFSIMISITRFITFSLKTLNLFSATCGGVLSIAPGTEEIIESPGYDDMHHYNSHQECNWWMKVLFPYSQSWLILAKSARFSDLSSKLARKPNEMWIS